MDKDKTAKVVAIVAAGLSTIWTNYKRAAVRRNGDSMGLFINDLFGIPVSDATGVKYLVEDVSEVCSHMRAKKEKKKFDNIIKNSF